MDSVVIDIFLLRWLIAVENNRVNDLEWMNILNKLHRNSKVYILTFV